MDDEEWIPRIKRTKSTKKPPAPRVELEDDEIEEEAMWATPTPQEWVPKGPLPTEPATNPWRPYGDTCLARTNEIGKVVYEEVGHRYALQDADGAYPDFIISGSGLVKYWEVVCALDPFYAENPLVVATRTLRDAQDRRNGADVTSSCTSVEGPMVAEVRQMLTEYLNKFVESWDRHPTFIERTADFIKCTPHKRKTNYTQHVRHRVIKRLEAWLLGEPWELPERYDADLVMIMRYLHDGSFDHVTAARSDGAKLADLLLVERLRLLEQGHTALVCSVSKAELASVPQTIPSRWGTVLHQHIERRLDPALGEPPEMREEEDHVQVEAFLKYLADSGMKVVAIEMRVGSLLYKICGSLDLLVQLPDGRFMIIDHKRVPTGEEWAAMVKKYGAGANAQVSFSDEFTKYSIQMAAYRKLLKLDYPHLDVVPEGLLSVFSPRATNFFMVPLQLEAPFRADTIPTTKGIADRWVNGERVVCKSPLSPTTFIEAFFEKRLEHLQAHFNVPM